MGSWAKSDNSFMKIVKCCWSVMLKFESGEWWRGSDDIVNGSAICPEEIEFDQILRWLSWWQDRSQALCSCPSSPPNLPSFHCLPVLHGTSWTKHCGCWVAHRFLCFILGFPFQETMYDYSVLDVAIFEKLGFGAKSCLLFWTVMRLVVVCLVGHHR
jgi:hypothetical protein